MSFVLVDQPRPHVALVTLNRPERMNAMAFDVMVPLREALEELEPRQRRARRRAHRRRRAASARAPTRPTPGVLPNIDGLTPVDDRAARHGAARRRRAGAARACTSR